MLCISFISGISPFIFFEAKESRFLKFISSQFQNIKSKTFYGSARPESGTIMKINSKNSQSKQDDEAARSTS